MPPAESIFDLPFTDDVDSAAVQGTLTRGGVTETVAGVVDFAPGRALQVTLTKGSTEVGEFLDCAGIGYQRRQPGGTWMASPQVSLIDRVLGWAGGPPPTGLRVAGWEATAGETAWHLESSAGASWWIGARTGHPLRFPTGARRGTSRLRSVASTASRRSPSRRRAASPHRRYRAPRAHS